MSGLFQAWEKPSTFYSVDKYRFSDRVALSTAIAGSLLPLGSLTQLGCLVALGGTLLLHRRHLGQRFLWLLFVVTFVGLVLNGGIPVVLVLVMFGAIRLTLAGKPCLGAAILTLSLSMQSSLVALLSQNVSHYGMELAAPAIVACLVVGLCGGVTLVRTMVLTSSSLLIAIGINSLEVEPIPGLTIVALFVGGSLIFVDLNKLRPRRVVLASVALVVIAGWYSNPPIAIRELHVFLPDDAESPEAKYFNNYGAALRLTGLTVSERKDLSDIGAKAVVFLPWLSSDKLDDAWLNGFKELARTRGWTTIICGEHTNYGRIASKVLVLTGSDLLNDDLLVPYRNSDESGHLHAADTRSWLPSAILNRGASVRLSSVFDRVLLAGDGWWIERNLGEWLWLGDFVWKRGDRSGRVPVAVSHSDKFGARWVVVGDTSLFLNQMLVEDPRPARQFFDIATLLPAFLVDLGLLVFGIFAIVAGLSGVAFRCAVLIIGTIWGTLEVNRGNANLPDWSGASLGETVFGDRSFSKYLSEYPQLLAARHIQRWRRPVSGRVAVGVKNSLLFFHVSGEAIVSEAKLSSCRRLGSLGTEQGPRIMDGQVCKLDGEANVLIGTREQAFAFSTRDENGSRIIVLDVSFLAPAAPMSNARWLLDVVGSQ